MANKKALLILGLVLVVVIILGVYLYLNKDNNLGGRDVEFEDLIPDDNLREDINFNGDYTLITDPLEFKEKNISNVVKLVFKEYHVKYIGNVEVIIIEIGDNYFNKELLLNEIGYGEIIRDSQKKSMTIKSQEVDVHYGKDDENFSRGAIYLWDYDKFFFIVSSSNDNAPGLNVVENIISKYKN